MPQSTQPEPSLMVIKPANPEPEIPERLIQVFLSQNLSQLGLGRLELVELEHPLPEVGRVDILARASDGTLYPIEVKRGVATRDAIGQLQSYVGELMSTYPSARVHGVLVAASLDGAATAALIATPTIDFWSYSAHFQFTKRPLVRRVHTSGLRVGEPSCSRCGSNMLAIFKEDNRTYCRKCGSFL
jgi:ribosomal protein S27AE